MRRLRPSADENDRPQVGVHDVNSHDCSCTELPALLRDS